MYSCIARSSRALHTKNIIDVIIDVSNQILVISAGTSFLSFHILVMIFLRMSFGKLNSNYWLMIQWKYVSYVCARLSLKARNSSVILKIFFIVILKEVSSWGLQLSLRFWCFHLNMPYFFKLKKNIVMILLWKQNNFILAFIFKMKYCWLFNHA